MPRKRAGRQHMQCARSPRGAATPRLQHRPVRRPAGPQSLPAYQLQVAHVKQPWLRHCPRAAWLLIPGCSSKELCFNKHTRAATPTCLRRLAFRASFPIPSRACLPQPGRLPATVLAKAVSVEPGGSS